MKANRFRFRAWDKLKNEMIDRPMNIYSTRSINLMFSDPHRVYMQSTGLTDKNGKEVFENDIVAPLAWDTEERPHIVVKWDSTPYTAGFTGSFGTLPYIGACEVLGNIHEHPELLDNSPAMASTGEDVGGES